MILKNLNTEITTIQGQNIMDATGSGMLTIKKAFIGCCEMHRPSKPAGSGEILQIFQLGLKLNASTEECEITNEEFDTLKLVITNSQIYVVAVIAKLLQYIDTIEK